MEQQASIALDPEQAKDLDYSKRSQWLRAAVLGANDGLVSTASLMMGVGSVKQDVKAMILFGLAGLVAGACSMVIGGYAQLDIQVAQMNRRVEKEEGDGHDDGDLPNPFKATAASALAFSMGAMVPLLAATFIKDYKVRCLMVVSAVTLALLVFGWLGATLGKAPVIKSSLRVLFGGWLVAMGITYGLTKLIATCGL